MTSVAGFFSNKELTLSPHRRRRSTSSWRYSTKRSYVWLLLLLFIGIGLWTSTRLLSRTLSSSNNEHNPSTTNRLVPNKEWIASQDDTKTKTRPLGRQQLCRYEGHCPVGYTCVAHEESNQGGVCEMYMLDDAPHLEATHACIQACMDEVRWEDHYQFGRRPEPIAYYSATGSMGRPDGCRIHYRRVDQAPHEVIEGDVYREWLKTRSAHRIVRVDPVYGKDDDNVTWSALCFNPCQNDEDCGRGFICDMQNDRNSCRHDNSYWTPTEAQKHDMVIVTGANSEYFMALKNLAASLCFWAPKHQLVIYNLGLSMNEIEEIYSWSNLLELKWTDDQFQRYPLHVRVDRYNYAWKPIAINESLHEYKSIFWMDAGSSLVGPIDPLIHITRQTGIFLVKGQDTHMSRYSSRKTYEWFNRSKATYRTGPHYAGNTQAYIFPSRYVDRIVKKAASCAMDRNCIAPVGYGIQNHRFDQTVLSLLAYEDDMQVPHHTEYLMDGEPQLERSPTIPRYTFVHTARRGEFRYREMGICNIGP